MTGLVLLLVGLGFGVHWLLTSPRFQVARLETSRYRFASRDSLENRLKARLGVNLWRCDLGSLSRDLEELSWIREAEIGRRLPGTLTVRLAEWRPRVLMSGTGGQLVALVDDGRVLALPDDTPVPDLPQFVINAGESEPDESVRSLVLDLLDVIDKGDLIASKSLDYILADERGLSIVLSGQRIRAVLGDEDWRARLLRLSAIVETVPHGAEVDLRFEGRVFVEQATPPTRR